MTISGAPLPTDLAKLFELERAPDPKEAAFVLRKERLLPYPYVKKRRVLPLDQRDGSILIACSKPCDFEVLEELRLLLKAPVVESLCDPNALEQAIEICYRQDESETSAFIEDINQSQNQNGKEEQLEGYDLLDMRTDSPVVRMLNMILSEAVQQGASDIHFEPLEQGMVVRYRIDGVLQSSHKPSGDFQVQIITRLKVMAKLDIAEHRLPQDGRIKLRMAGREIDFRVSTVPVVYGERLVLRILDKGNVLLGLDKIGMPATLLKQFKMLTRQNQGIVLVTGPTGSGKTTTLYSAISDLNSDEVNIMTIEDPVEYKLPGMAQIGVNRKINLTFPTGLRHILRQDPDIIMIGEIRDKETAGIAIQSSFTGHLVLSTLHTNDAPSALTRLIDMGIEPYLISSSVLGVLAQRLVRRICPHCQESYSPSKQELFDLGLPSGSYQFAKGRGCAHCFHSGYKGRLGIYELMILSTPIKAQMVASADATQLRKIARDEGMKTLREQGAEKVLLKETTTAEVLRVTRSVELD